MPDSKTVAKSSSPARHAALASGSTKTSVYMQPNSLLPRDENSAESARESVRGRDVDDPRGIFAVDGLPNEVEIKERLGEIARQCLVGGFLEDQHIARPDQDALLWMPHRFVQIHDNRHLAAARRLAQHDQQTRGRVTDARLEELARQVT